MKTNGFFEALDINNESDVEVKQKEELEANKDKLTFDRLIMEKYKEDKDLEFQKFYKENKKMLHEMIFNNISYSDLELYDQELPIQIEDPLVGSTFDLIIYKDTISESVLVTKYCKDNILDDKELFLRNINQENKEDEEWVNTLGGHLIDAGFIDECPDTNLYIEDYYYSQPIFQKEDNTLDILDENNVELLDNATIIGYIGIPLSYVTLKYGFEKEELYEDENDNIRILMKDTMSIFVRDALNTFLKGEDTFKALELELSVSYLDVENKRHFIDEVFEFKPEFERYYDKSLPEISNEEALKNFLKNLKFTLDLGEKHNSIKNELKK